METTTASLTEDLGAIVGAAHVHIGDSINPDYRVDESLGATPGSPVAVVEPASTAEVSAVVAVCRARGVALVPRGAGTGLSHGAVPPDGSVVVSLTRMNSILEVDTAGHTVVVQPGVTLAELNAALADVHLVYPVFPGTDAASIGGTVATNAGGMRAVKYGVTRQQVLGLEVVTGTGEVVRTGGAFVKCATGYDMAQLIVGSEGTLGLVTEVTLRLWPLLEHSATLLVPYDDVESIALAVPRIVASGVAPMILEYIDSGTMKGILNHNQMTLGVPSGIIESTRAFLVVVLEARSSERLNSDVEFVAEVIGEEASDVFVLEGGQGERLLRARENAFWMVKAAGADDLIDMVVPRARIPQYLREVRSIAREVGSRVYGCGHAGDGNIHFSVYEPDPDTRHELLIRIYTAGRTLGGEISGEHGLGRTKTKYHHLFADPARLEHEQRIKSVFDPDRILNPGVVV